MLAFENVTRVFRGGEGVTDLTFAVEPGEVVCLIGLNGAGKTTLMRLVLGMLRPQAGTVRALGYPMSELPAARWAQVGALIEVPLAYPELTVRKNLHLAALLHGASPECARSAIGTWRLTLVADRRFRRLSLGNRQRVGLAAAMQHDPRLIVLDEPSTALDPASVILLCEELIGRAREGASILVSSHHLDEVARIAESRAADERGPTDRVTQHDWARPRTCLLRAHPRRRRTQPNRRGLPMRAAMRVEALKLTHSLVGVIATLAVVAGMLALLGGITAGVAGGNPELVAKAGSAGVLNWDGLLAGAAQITAVASILGFGIVLAWMFGREFAEGTVTGLFGLPVSRTRIALAKLTVYALWATVVSVALTAGVLVLGLTLAYGPPSSQTWGALGRVLVLAMLSAGIAVPVAWVATFSRSLLAAVGCTVALVVVAEVGALA